MREDGVVSVNGGLMRVGDQLRMIVERFLAEHDIERAN
jgi:hypothetical protein